MSDKYNDLDSFWDIDKLVPKKKTVSSSFSTSSGVKEYTVHYSDAQTEPSEEHKLTFSEMRTQSREEVTEYVPSEPSLIRRVRLKRYVDKFDFYGNFRKTALIYYDYKTQRCDFVPFYSYMPQYTQLTSQQKAYYFYWRDEIRRGRYIKCDYSYLYLYVYEILNLPDKIEPARGIKLLTNLWREYREALPRIDAYMSVWVQDYCFVHNIPCPMDEIRDFIFDVISGADFKEFYLSDVADAGADGTGAMIAYLSDYDWRRSKYACGDNKEIFKNHMIGSLRAYLDRYSISGAQSEEGLATLRRDAFPHSLCTHAVKCKLEIDYVPLSKDDAMRQDVTAAVRYAENKLRALLGAKSRLGIKGLPDEAKFIIDRYFENIFEIERKRRERECAPEYERLYDAEDKQLSFADADEIERASWVTTARLVLDAQLAGDDACISVEQAEEPIHSPSPMAEEPCIESEENTGTSSDRINTFGLLESDISLLSRLIMGERGVECDDALERINEAALDSPIGDIILEHNGEEYVIVEDYLDDVRSWLDGIS